MKRLYTLCIALTYLLVGIGCNKANIKEEAIDAVPKAKENALQKTPLSKEFKNYWYTGQAEINSYQLAQERYGEIRDGKAVLIYVTEDFSTVKQVKADNHNKTNTPVLKLNTTKTFNTGIYPYSIMESSFYPVGQESHALKLSASVQEWCGQVYTQLNNRESFDISSHSYFEGEADENFKISKAHLENEIWNRIRIHPAYLPLGEIQMVPSLEFSQLRHRQIKAYTAIAFLEKGKYTLSYPDLDRKLIIYFNPEFPYTIEGWEESNLVGYGRTKQYMTTTARRLKSLKTAYWTKSSNSDQELRNELMLD